MVFLLYHINPIMYYDSHVWWLLHCITTLRLYLYMIIVTFRVCWKLQDNNDLRRGYVISDILMLYICNFLCYRNHLWCVSNVICSSMDVVYDIQLYFLHQQLLLQPSILYSWEIPQREYIIYKINYSYPPLESWSACINMCFGIWRDTVESHHLS